MKSQNTLRKTRISEPVSVVAHQLKNPITVLKSYLEVLESQDIGKINAKQREYLRISLENVQKMSAMVGNLLDVSQIEEDRYNLRPRDTDLVEIIQEVIDDLSLWAKARNSEIIFTPPKELPRAYVDPAKIRTVLENLISNAVKYKDLRAGKVEIDVELKAGEILFTCKDNGFGIPKLEHGKVFSKFYRSSEALDVEPSGTGIGLYINKAIIGLSGGKIWFKRNKDVGITFYFTLPLA